MKKLILLPNALHEESTWNYTPPQIDALIAESDKGGYQFLKRFNLPKCPVYLLNEHTQKPAELIQIQEEVVGLISDAGLPCLADPGAVVVQAARRAGIAVDAIPGPSSLMMALQLSGFSGQAFTFHGYFPREENSFASLLKKLGPQTHIFIETPYKTHKIFDLLIKHLPPQAQLCIAVELMGPHAYVRTDSIDGWKKKPLPIQKGRAVYLICTRNLKVD
ncbi:MAG: SAM-dependent methyltransferase [Rhabdochlamydiaceae bacterium]